MTSQQEKERLLDNLRECTNHHRTAIRWLSEVEKFYITYSGDSWKGDKASSLASIAKKDFDEAQSLVITSRKNLEAAREELAAFHRKMTK